MSLRQPPPRAPRTGAPRRRAAHRTALAAALSLAACWAAGDLRAQQRLVGLRTVHAGPSFETWRFGGGARQLVGGDTIVVRSVTQWSVPIVAVVPLGREWTMEVSGAFSSGQVTLDGEDRVLRTDRYVLSGPTDIRVRAVGSLVRDRVLVTVGVNAPTGRTGLDAGEVAALRALAAPALRLQVPANGTGPGGTAGLVLAHRMAGWAWALGVAYELRGTYSPIAALTAGAPSVDYRPGGALHASIGAEGFIGEHGMSLSLTVDRFAEDELTLSGDGSVGTPPVVQLGSTLTAEWQLRVAARGWRQLTLYAADRYRSRYRQAGVTVAGSSGNQLDVGARGVLALSPSAGLVVGVSGRHHTGLDVGGTLATAGIAAAGATVGVARTVGRYTLEPFVRAQAGRIDVGGTTSSALGISGGIALGTRF
jgi:hypothetical protein